MMNSIHPLPNNRVPVSINPRQSFLTILENVAVEQSRWKDGLCLAAPMIEIITFYESRLS